MDYLQNRTDVIAACGCALNPSECPPPKPRKPPEKYFRQIGAEVIGNQLIIRMQKEKNKKKRNDEWYPPCDCVEIKGASKTQGPKIIKTVDNDQILLKTVSKSGLTKIAENSHNFGYRIGFCEDREKSCNECRAVTVYPTATDESAQEVYTDHLIENDREIYFLKIRKKAEAPEEKEKKIELEVITPRPPTPPPPPPEFVDKPRRIKARVCKKAKRKRSSSRLDIKIVKK
ncbi:uncharacterized protein [Prorops nasuta]|uniref:uncharacterized protein n=1 Tax=Prorops nasuta TaxID=863751 RepID=UPI0034CD7BF4